MDKAVATQTWGALANAIDEIYNRNASQLSFEELYRNAYNLVLHKYGNLLYEGVTDKLNQHLSETAKRLEQVPDSKLLEDISTTWAEHQVSKMRKKYCSLGYGTCLRYCEVPHINQTFGFSSFPIVTDYHDHGP